MTSTTTRSGGLGRALSVPARSEQMKKGPRMWKLSIRIPYFSGLFSALLLLGCQQTATAPASRHVSRSDLDFMTGVSNLVQFDHDVIGKELQRSSDPRVQALAKDLLARIDSFNSRVQPIAARDGIVPPADMSLFQQSDMQTRIATLMATSKYDFDQEFVSDELAGNQQILAQAEQVIREPSGDPELRALLSDALARLKGNVDRLKSLQSELKA